MNVTLLTIVVLIAVGIGIYLIVEYKVKKWSCVEGKCEKILRGQHSSLEQCQQQCSVKQPFKSTEKDMRTKKKEKRVSFSPVVGYSPTPPSTDEFVLVN